jgi:hypothetical protein
VGGIAKLDAAEETLLDKSKLTRLRERGVNGRLAAASFGHRAVAVNCGLQVAKLILDPACPLQKVKLAGIQSPADADVGEDRLPKFLPGLAQTSWGCQISHSHSPVRAYLVGVKAQLGGIFPAAPVIKTLPPRHVQRRRGQLASGSRSAAR